MSAQELKGLGNAAFSQGKYEEAVAHFTKAIELDSNDHIFFSNRSAAYAGMERWVEALEDAKRCNEIKPDWAKGYTRTGLALYRMGRVEEAAQAYQTGLEHDPNNASLQEGLAECQNVLRNQQPNMANPFGDIFGPSMYSKLESHPSTRQHMQDPAFVSVLQQIEKQPQKLQEHLNDPRIMEAFSVLLGMGSPDHFEKMQAEAAEHRRQEEKRRREEEERRRKEEEEARIKAEQEAEAKLPEEERERLRNARRAEGIKDEGNELYKARKFQEAKAKYEEALTLDPTQAAFVGNLAAVCLAQQQYDECIKLCKEAIALGQEHATLDFQLHARLLLRIGHALFKQLKYDESLDYIHKSLLEDRTSAANRLLKSVEVAKKKAEDEAYLDPVKSEEAKDRGNEHFKAGRWREALDEYTDAIRRDPKNYRAFANRAACNIKVMEWERALEDCDKCIQLNPKFVKAYIRKGNVKTFLKQYHQALEAYEMGLAVDPSSEELLQARMNVIQQINSENATGEVDPQRAKEALKDPQIQAILQNPVIAQVLKDLGPKGDRTQAEKVLQDPDIMAQLEKLVAAGIVRMG